MTIVLNMSKCLADNDSLMNKADVEVLSNVASEILGSVTSEKAQEK